MCVAPNLSQNLYRYIVKNCSAIVKNQRDRARTEEAGRLEFRSGERVISVGSMASMIVCDKGQIHTRSKLPMPRLGGNFKTVRHAAPNLAFALHRQFVRPKHSWIQPNGPGSSRGADRTCETVSLIVDPNAATPKLSADNGHAHQKLKTYHYYCRRRGFFPRISCVSIQSVARMQ